MKQKRGDAKANEKATEAELNQARVELLQAKKVDEALSLFQRNAHAQRTSWNVYDSLAEAQLTKGDNAKALSLVKDDANHERLEQTLSVHHPRRGREGLGQLGLRLGREGRGP